MQLRPGTGRWVVLLVTALPSFMVALNLLVVSVAFPAIQASFAGSSTAELSWVVNAHNIVYAALLVPAGRAADRWGRRRVFSVGLVVFGLASLSCALSGTVPLLVAGRVAQGVGSALLTPSSLGLLLAAYPAEERARAVASWGALSALGAALGPSLGAALVQASQWRVVFLVYVPLSLATLAIGRAVLGESRDREAGPRPDWLGVVVLALALTALALTIVEGPAWGWASPRTLASLAGTGLALGVFLVRSARHPEPVLDLRLFRIPSFRAANLATLVFSIAFFAQVLAGILFLTQVWRFDLLHAALAITPTPALAALVGAPAGRLATRWGFRAVTVPGILLYAAAALWFLAFVGPEPDYVRAWLPGAVLAGVAIGVAFPILGAAAVSQVPPARFAVAGAVGQTARQVGAVLGVASLVAILGPRGAGAGLAAFDRFWVLAAALAVASALVSGLITRLAPDRPAARSPGEQVGPAARASRR